MNAELRAPLDSLATLRPAAIDMHRIIKAPAYKQAPPAMCPACLLKNIRNMNSSRDIGGPLFSCRVVTGKYSSNVSSGANIYCNISMMNDGEGIQ